MKLIGWGDQRLGDDEEGEKVGDMEGMQER